MFLLAEQEPTLGIATASLRAAESGGGGPLYVETLGIPDELRRRVERDWTPDATIDAAISYLLGATSGRGYVNQIGRLQSYPIPDIPIGAGDGRLLLDIGSSWGRWAVSAARKGWQVVGLDPSIGAIAAAKRAFSRSGLDMTFVCGDARFMPFQPDSFQCVFSYSVIQHFSEIGRGDRARRGRQSVTPRRLCQIQMAHKGGLRSTYSRTRREYVNSGRFRVRYWSLPSLQEVFERTIGRSTLTAEAYGGLGLLPEDQKYVSSTARALIAVSALLKRLSTSIGPLIYLADSVYVLAEKR